ncbi:MAG: hypothetical protein CSA97_01030 [Bacteroidetes bacterium]|nr:MAG: hypothetical protein CSA97_01030 [Bacteroidota bacterium]
MEREQVGRIRYMVALISEFAKLYGLAPGRAYLYLKRFGGMDYVEEHYEVLHTLSFAEVLSDLSVICQRHGGFLMYDGYAALPRF